MSKPSPSLLPSPDSLSLPPSQPLVANVQGAESEGKDRV
jgi:hypothetical protein